MESGSRNVFRRIFVFYRDGFRSMTVGKTLWTLILIKLFIMFAVLKIFFFPNFLGKYDTDEQKGEHVINEFVERSK